MSAAHAYAPGPSGRSLPRTEHAPRPVLHVVRGVAPARGRLPVLLLILVLLLTPVFASTYLNAAMADTAFKLHDAQQRLAAVNEHIDTVNGLLQEASAPDSLAQRATELGMVPAGAPGVVDLTTGTASGGSAAKRG